MICVDACLTAPVGMACSEHVSASFASGSIHARPGYLAARHGHITARAGDITTRARENITARAGNTVCN